LYKQQHSLNCNTLLIHPFVPGTCIAFKMDEMLLLTEGSKRMTADGKKQTPETKTKINCWEYKKCGRQPGGPKANELGICPAAADEHLNGTHGGKNAGRACWVVAGSLCGGKIQGTYARKLLNCWRCEFMNAVKLEEESSPFGFSHTRLGMERALEKQRTEAVSASLQNREDGSFVPPGYTGKAFPERN
jgi:hypothetical protein